MTEALSRERILEAAEDVLRRFGPQKTTVVDVARALNVSHAAIYRHFPSKADLRNAVTRSWLSRVAEPLEEIVQRDASGADRLVAWLDALVAIKWQRTKRDPEMFETYLRLFSEQADAVRDHVDHLTGQLERIIRVGIADGTLAADDPASAARAVFDATSRFHNPAHALTWSDPDLHKDYEAVRDLVVAGLTAHAPGRHP